MVTLERGTAAAAGARVAALGLRAGMLERVEQLSSFQAGSREEGCLEACLRCRVRLQDHKHEHEHGHKHEHKHTHADHAHHDDCAACDHDHDHGHKHEHKHEHTHADHAHHDDCAACGHDHHDHDHEHKHEHNHADHEHHDDCAACGHDHHDHEHHHHDHKHTHKEREATLAAKRFGISSFVYSRRRPFHPQRLKDMVLKWLPVTSNTAIDSEAPEAGDAPIKKGERGRRRSGLSAQGGKRRERAVCRERNGVVSACSEAAVGYVGWTHPRASPRVALCRCSFAGFVCSAAVQGVHVDEQQPQHGLLLEPRRAAL